MALTVRVAVACNIAVNTAGTQLNFTDTTGTYNATTYPLGYGVTGGITSANVTTFTLVLTWGSLATSITYTFTVASNVITAATLTDTTGTVYNIFSQLTSTVFPFVTANPFNLVTAWTNTGIKVPDFDDDVYTLDYTITGTGSGDAFSYTASTNTVRTFDVCCCLTEKGADLDPTCQCEDEAIWNFLRTDVYLSAASMSADSGKDANAVAQLNKAIELCDCEGCN